MSSPSRGPSSSRRRSPFRARPSSSPPRTRRIRGWPVRRVARACTGSSRPLAPPAVLLDRPDGRRSPHRPSTAGPCVRRGPADSCRARSRCKLFLSEQVVDLAGPTQLVEIDLLQSGKPILALFSQLTRRSRRPGRRCPGPRPRPRIGLIPLNDARQLARFGDQRLANRGSVGTG